MTLAIGPANYAGQAHAWARAAGVHLGIDTQSFGYRTKPFRIGPGPAFTFPVDKTLPHPRTITAWGRRLRLRSLASNSHIMLDGFVPIGRAPGQAIDSDVAFLTRRSSEVAFISHGSDLRHPDLHRHHFRASYFDHADDDWVNLMRRQVEQNQETLRSFPHLPLFVSTPDQLLLYPGAIWLPLTVDPATFDFPTQEALARPIPTILHIPTRRNPPIKGTHLIDPILRSLQARGKVRYVSPKSVRHEDMLRLMATADIVIDQILTGAYGVTAVEAMSLGRLVIGGVSDEVRSVMPEAPPIIDATADSLEQIILDIVANPTTYATIAHQGRHFASRWHSGQAAANVIGSWIRS